MWRDTNDPSSGTRSSSELVIVILSAFTSRSSGSQVLVLREGEHPLYVPQALRAVFLILVGDRVVTGAHVNDGKAAVPQPISPFT